VAGAGDTAEERVVAQPETGPGCRLGTIGLERFGDIAEVEAVIVGPGLEAEAAAVVVAEVQSAAAVDRTVLEKASAGTIVAGEVPAGGEALMDTSTGFLAVAVAAVGYIVAGRQDVADANTTMVTEAC
jgi:hypothetical protein